MRTAASTPTDRLTPKGRPGGLRRGAGRSMLRRTTAVLLAAVAVGTGATLVGARPVAAQSSGVACAPTVAVSRTSGLAAEGETVTVTGSCFDPAKGVYVALCLVPAPGAAPTPCGGGAALEGSTGASQWISSNPPPYAQGLTIPWGPGGSFSVTLRVSARLDAANDCRVVRCAVATKADHTRSSDRSQDVVVPVTFAGGGGADGRGAGGGGAAPAAPAPTTPPAPTTTAPPSPPEPETTTTTEPEPTTTTEASTTTTSTPGSEVDAELASAPGDTGSGAGPVVLIAVVVLLLAGGAAAGLLWRRRSDRGGA